MILTCLYLTGCGREEVPYLDTTQTQEQTVETERTEQKETLKSDPDGTGICMRGGSSSPVSIS